MSEIENRFNDLGVFKQSFLNSNEAMIIFNSEGFLSCNKELAKFLELASIDDFNNLNPFEIIPQYQPDGSLSHIKFNKYLETCKQVGEIKFDWLYKTLNNKDLFVEVFLKKLRYKNKDYFLAKWLNKNELRKLEKELEHNNLHLEKTKNYLDELNNVFKEQNINKEDLLNTLFLLNEYKSAIDESSIVSKSDKVGKITFANDKFCEISGYSRDELLGNNHNIVRHPSMGKEFFKNLWNTILNKQIFRGVIINRNKSGNPYYVDTTIVPIVDKNNEIIEFIAVRHDITQVYEKEKIIQEQYMDDLTLLPNRQKLIRDLKDTKTASIVLIDIVKFKDINEYYGYEIGDLVLKEFAKILQNLEIFGLNFYKLSNDTFAILVLKNSLIDDLPNLLNKILNKIEKSKIVIQTNNFMLNIFMAIVSISNFEKPLTAVEFAMNLAKNKNKKILFLEDFIEEYEKIQKNKELIDEIKNAILEKNILIFGQKIINNTTKEEKYEILMRLKTRDGKILSPYTFLDISKKANIYLDLTKILVKKSCNYFKDKNSDFSINLTIEDIKDKKTIDYIFKIIKETNTASKITFEIVESEAIDDFDLMDNFIQKAKKLGCKIAIDDFGTGYSNFEYVIKLNIDFIKIDGSLIKNISNDKNIELAVKTINSFAKILNIKTVAEFVHNKEVLEKVNELNIDYSQGYYLHEPEFFV